MEKEKELQFIPVVNYIKQSNLHYAVTANVDIYDRLIREFWRIAKLVKNNNQITISAKIDEHDVEIS